MRLLNRHALLPPVTLGLLATAVAAGAAPPAQVTCKDGTVVGGADACANHGGLGNFAAKGAGGSTPSAEGATPLQRNMLHPSTGGEGGPITPPVNQPESVMFRCRDGTTAQGGPDACRDHGGHAAAIGSAGGPPGAPAPGSLAAAVARTPAPGAGPGLVWTDTQSRFYHCFDDTWYGKTDKGMYTSEAAARSQGYQPQHEPCR